MSTPQQIEAFYGRLWSTGDLTAVPELLHQNFHFRGSLGADVRGHEAFKDYVRKVRQALEDYHCEILDCVTEGTKACVKVKFAGRHVAPFRGFAATGKPVHWVGSAWFQFEGDTIVGLWVVSDTPGLEALLRANQDG